jgi:hypothetical protein
MALIAIVATVVIVAIGTGVFFVLRPGPRHIRNVADSGLSSPARSATAAQSPASQAAQGSGSARAAISSASPAASSAPPTAPSPVSTSGPTPSLSTVGSVTVSASAAQNPDANAVASFVSEYFSAINGHSFQAYDALMTPQVRQGQTAQSFSNGFGSSSESDETLVAITPAANGDTAATLTFTSHQNASQAEGNTGTCTDWSITLFLESNGIGYLDGEAPSTYHSHYASCE